MTDCQMNDDTQPYFTRHPWITAALLLVGFTLFATALYSYLAHALLFLPEGILSRRMLDLSQAFPGWISTALIWIANIGSIAPNIITLWLSYIYLRRRCDDQFVLLLASYGLGLAIFWTLAVYFDRVRPSLPGLLASVPFPSFPSGHMIQTATLIIPLLYFYLPGVRSKGTRWGLIAVSAAYFVFIALNRLITDAHYLTDVMAGMGIGIFWSVGVLLVYEWTKARQAERGARSTAEAARPNLARGRR